MNDGNTRKNDKHGVSMAEAEQVFSTTRSCLLPMLNTARVSAAFTH